MGNEPFSPGANARFSGCATVQSQEVSTEVILTVSPVLLVKTNCPVPRGSPEANWICAVVFPQSKALAFCGTRTQPTAIIELIATAFQHLSFGRDGRLKTMG
jgi:hypothetical protein